MNWKSTLKFTIESYFLDMRAPFWTLYCCAFLLLTFICIVIYWEVGALLYTYCTVYNSLILTLVGSPTDRPTVAALTRLCAAPITQQSTIRCILFFLSCIHMHLSMSNTIEGKKNLHHYQMVMQYAQVAATILALSPIHHAHFKCLPNILVVAFVVFEDSNNNKKWRRAALFRICCLTCFYLIALLYNVEIFYLVLVVAMPFNRKITRERKKKR